MNNSVVTREKALCELCLSAEHEHSLARGWDFEYSTTCEEFAFVVCQKCGLLYLAERPERDFMKVIYPENYYAYSESSGQNKLIKAVRDNLEKRKIGFYKTLLGEGVKAVFDAGCGDGRVLDIIKTYCSNAWMLSGIEISSQAAEKAKDKGYEILAGDIEEADLRHLDGKFDLVLMHQMIEHTRSPRRVIQKVHSLLKYHGVLSIETPDTNSWDRRIFGKRYWGGYHFPRHFYLFNKATLCQLLQEHGFEIISCHSLLSPVFWIHSWHNYFKDRGSKYAGFFHYQNPFLLTLAASIDLLQLIFSRTSSNMQIIARKKNKP